MRIDDARPKVVVSASCGIEPTRVIEYKPLLDAALELAGHAARPLRDRAAPAGDGGARRARPRLGDGDAAGRGPAGRVRAGRRHGPALHPLHLGDDGPAEGHRARQRRPCGRAAVVDGQRVRRPRRRGVLGGQRRGVGRRPLLHRVRAAAGRRHDRPLRGQAGGDAGRGRVLAGRRRPPGDRAVHRADGLPRDQEGGPGGGAARPVRRLVAADPLPRGGAARPGHLRVGVAHARHPGDRQLVADRDRLADLREPRAGSTRCR